MNYKKVIKISSIILAVLCISLYLGLHLIAFFMPPLNVNEANGTYYYDSNNNLFNGTTREWINLDKISKNLINATIAAEDKNFYNHDGFDYLRIGKAF